MAFREALWEWESPPDRQYLPERTHSRIHGQSTPSGALQVVACEWFTYRASGRARVSDAGSTR